METEQCIRYIMIADQMNNLKHIHQDQYLPTLKQLINNNNQRHTIDNIIIIFMYMIYHKQYLHLIKRKKVIDALKLSIVHLSNQLIDHNNNPDVDEEKYPKDLRDKCMALLNEMNEIIRDEY